MVSAEDGQQTLDIFTNKIDIVLLDIMLPEKSGVDALVNYVLKNQIPIIMLTALDDEIDKAVGLEWC